MLKKDYLLAIIAGVVTAFFLLPVLKNASIDIPYYQLIFLIIPLLWCAVIFVSSFFKSQVIKQFAKFIIVGSLNTSIDLGILNLMSMKYHIYSGIKVVGVNPFSFIAALANSFIWNKYWTFGEKEGEFEEIPKFLTVAAVGLFINTGILYLITNFVNFGGLLPGQILNLGKLLATAVSLIWNFTGMKIFVFNSKSGLETKTCV